MTATYWLQFVLNMLTYFIMGLVFGVGVVVSRKYPQVGEFLKQRPIIGWGIVVALVYAAATVLITTLEFTALLILEYLSR